MSENTVAGANNQGSLKQMAGKNFMLSLLLFAVLIAIVFAASLRERGNMDQLTTVYQDQFRVEQFKASLSSIMLPINDFTMTADKANFEKIRQAVKAYRVKYDHIKSIPHLTSEDKTALAQVHSLMNEVMHIADDVANEKIPANQASSVTVLAQNLVLTAQVKLESIVQGLEKQLQLRSVESRDQASMQLYILLALIILIIVLVEFLNRKLLTHAQTVSKVSSNVAESAGDIIEVNKMQADATEQQSKFMEKVIKGLELIAESGAKIASTTSTMEKNAGVIASFAKGGIPEVGGTIEGLEKTRNNLTDANEHTAAIGDKAEQVLKSLDQIQEVADEANLLALNASIDASGGASVTNEVQRMADQIRGYSEEIRSAVQDISGASSDAGNATEKGMSALEQSLEIAQSTSEMLNRIDNMADKNAQSAGIIAQATNRQNERNHKILQALQHISELLHISGHKLKAYKEASARLSEASESLQNLS